ncbi:MAG: class I SAM-dependent methyltransferase [Bacteriovoracaceae bacterium]|nr:class I SAM-dependent methyltransferase [Bacteriovoracaceae bacterium]
MTTDYEKRYQELKETHQLEYEYPPSLKHFLENDVIDHTKIDLSKELQILELGCGAGTLFNDNYENPKVTSIDVSPTALEYAREKTKNKNVIFLQGEWGGDFPYLTENSFDFAIDAHCLHCLIDKEKRVKALEQAYQAIKPGGWLGLEHMVSHSGMEFEPPYQFTGDVLYYAGEPQKFIPHSIEIEEEIKSVGFEIRYLRVFETLKIIPVSGRNTPLRSDPDLLRLLCTKV